MKKIDLGKSQYPNKEGENKTLVKNNNTKYQQKKPGREPKPSLR
jgi:hypothetical protein